MVGDVGLLALGSGRCVCRRRGNLPELLRLEIKAKISQSASSAPNAHHVIVLSSVN